MYHILTSHLFFPLWIPILFLSKCWDSWCEAVTWCETRGTNSLSEVMEVGYPRWDEFHGFGYRFHRNFPKTTSKMLVIWWILIWNWEETECNHQICRIYFGYSIVLEGRYICKCNVYSNLYRIRPNMYLQVILSNFQTIQLDKAKVLCLWERSGTKRRVCQFVLWSPVWNCRVDVFQNHKNWEPLATSFYRISISCSIWRSERPWFRQLIPHRGTRFLTSLPASWVWSHWKNGVSKRLDQHVESRMSRRQCPLDVQFEGRWF